MDTKEQRTCRYADYQADPEGLTGAEREWSGSPDHDDPDNYWIDDDTGERVCAETGARTPPAPHKEPKA